MNIAPLPEVSLTLPYHEEFLSLITRFVAEAGQTFGANEKESFTLRLAAEEVFTYIMEAFPSTEKDAIFHLKCAVGADALTFSFSNHGTPINARSTPEFKIEDAEATIAGLGLSLAKKVTDDFRFINLGSDGWLIMFTKKLAGFRPLYKHQITEEPASVKPPSKKLHIYRATAEHVPKLINLVYRTYRYSYAKSYFYDDQSLKTALEEEHVIALVAENEQGDIVGNVAVFFDSPHVAEIGGVMIDPEYRSSMGMLLLVKEAKRLFLGDRFAATTFYGKTVTTHTYSQHLMATMKFAPLGLRLSTYTHAKFIDIDDHQGNRESLVFGVLNAKTSCKATNLYVPPVHEAIIKELYANAGREVTEINNISTESLPAEPTKLTILPNEKTQFAEITIEQIGHDFSKVLKKEIFTLQQNGCLTCLLNIPTIQPLPANIDQLLKENNFFFNGLQLNAQGEWQIMYTNLFHQRFQFANIQIYDPLALKLRNYIEAQYVSLY